MFGEKLPGSVTTDGLKPWHRFAAIRAIANWTTKFETAWGSGDARTEDYAVTLVFRYNSTDNFAVAGIVFAMAGSSEF